MVALTEIVIANMALSRAGVLRPLPAGDGTLANSTDGSIELQACQLWYPICRDRCLEGFPWPFARAFATLTLADDGTDEIWEEEWANAYNLPADCLRAWRFVTDRHAAVLSTGCGLAYYVPQDDARPFVIREHGGAQVILTDVEEADADLEYTKQVTDPTRFSFTFASALAYLLGSEVSEPLSVSPERAERLRQLYLMEGAKAASQAANEEQPPEDGDGRFLRSRAY